jgi:hypothetical protein
VDNGNQSAGSNTYINCTFVSRTNRFCCRTGPHDATGDFMATAVRTIIRRLDERLGRRYTPPYALAVVTDRAVGGRLPTGYPPMNIDADATRPWFMPWSLKLVHNYRVKTSLYMAVIYARCGDQEDVPLNISRLAYFTSRKSLSRCLPT